MPSRYCFAVGLLLSGQGELGVHGQKAKGAVPPALRRLRNNDAHRGPSNLDTWHRFSAAEEDEGSDFVDLLRQTSPQYMMQQHQDVFDEMLARAFDGISAGFSIPVTSAPTPAVVARVPETNVPTTQPTFAPQPEDDIVITSEGTPVDIAVLDNDQIVSDSLLRLTNFTQPSHGEVTLNSDGTTLKYTPDENYINCPDPEACDPVIPLDCFRYEACNQDDFCSWANVCVEVTAPNDAPQPEDDTAITTANTPVDISVLDNDLSTTGSPLRVNSLEQSSNGLVTVNPDGTSINYAPSLDYSNCPDPQACNPVVPLDCFRYEACNQDDFCSWANVCVEVTAPNDAPQPEDDTAITAANTPVDISVLDNDLSTTGSPLRVNSLEQSSNGLVTVNPDGTTINYAPSLDYSNCPDPQACNPVVPLDCFRYEACNQDDFCSWANVCVEVTALDNAPQPEDDTSTTTEGMLVDIDVLANDVSITGAPLRLGNFTQPQNGLVILNPNDIFEYTPSPGYSNCPDSEACNPIIPLDCFQYQSCDSQDVNQCSWATACVEVTPQTSAPSPLPTTASPTANPTFSPTLPCGMSREQRAEEILFALVDVSSPSLLSDESTPQGKAFRWIVDQDELYVCPSDNTCDLIQRYVLAVIYFSTNGDNWFQCSGNPLATDDCGNDFPFDAGQSRFLDPVSECEWAGIKCSEDLCVTEIEFELNNLVGTIPEEIGRLALLEVLGMERGGLTSTIPSVLGQLTSLYFLDLDYNALTGSIPTELSSLTELEQLDLNDNRLTGTIEPITTLTKVFFLQLHNNRFTGTVPERLGAFSELGAATLHTNQFTGEVPSQVCALRDTFGGPLLTLTADCDPPENPEINCTCCTECRNN